MKVLLIKSKTCKSCRNQIEEFTNGGLQGELIQVDISDYPIAMNLMKHFQVHDVPTSIVVKDSFSLEDKTTWTAYQKFLDFIGNDVINEYLSED